jgi:DNA-binding PadR family transcriptional regulator
MPPGDSSQPSTTEAAILGLVAFGERSGYDLARLAEQSVGYLWAPSRSQIYKILPRLVQRGLARSRRVRQRDRPDKDLYRITPAGRRLLRQWLEHVDDPASGESNVFALKIFFCDLVPMRTARAQLEGYRGFLEVRLERFELMLQGLVGRETVFPRLILRRAIVRIRVTLEWLEEAIEVIDKLETARSRPEPEARHRGG